MLLSRKQTSMSSDNFIDITYLDNASTTYPKPACVWEAAKDYIENIGANPGRSGNYLARKAENVVANCRDSLARLFNIKDPNSIALTFNATHALNTVLKGTLNQGDHVIITNFEHNSVIRPIEKLKRTGIVEYDVVDSNVDGIFQSIDFEAAIKTNTKLIVINHASNVIGVIAPIEEVIKIAHRHGVQVLVDASQTAGFLDIDVEALDIDYLVFTGHKALLGASGTGGFYAKDPYVVRTLMEGGSGSNSLSPVHPGVLPDKFEAGTMNYLGIAGLGASLEQLLTTGIAINRTRELDLTKELLEGLSAIEDITIYGTTDIDRKVPVLSFNITGQTASEVATVLDQKYKIMVRPGLQCAPLIHKTLGTSPNGTVRISLGASTTQKDIHTLLSAVQEVVHEKSTLIHTS